MGVVLGLLLTGCAVGDVDPGASAQAPRSDLAGEAEVAAANVDDGTADARPGEARPRDRGAGKRRAAARSTGAGAGGVVPEETQASPAPSDRPEGRGVVLGALDDPTGDHGGGPGYTDLTAVVFRERGSALSVTVSLAGTVPGTLTDGEVQGVGIDLYRSSHDESDCQVFLDGGRHGWRAFLQTPRGFVDFPGTFAVRGRTLTVTVPWDSLGGRGAASSSLFVDWSDGMGGVASDSTSRVELRPS